ncbi:MAG: DUF1223 domain-containing protein [Gammaproteobacteria bacterium]|nr:DUF1223 domain-containing protein [Gammaproteobacteria bacterium]
MSLSDFNKMLTKSVQYLLVTATLISTPLVSIASQTIHLQSGDQKNTLIELYTSQGCSSCPPAERWLGKLQDDPRLWSQLIPVAFHVDYWDYIGWKDQFARPEFSQRQQRYQNESSIKTVYTPGFVINGKEWRSWFGLRKIPHKKERSGVLTIDLNGDKLDAHYDPGSMVGKKRILDLNVAIVGIGLKANVTRGENFGKELSQDFVALDLVSRSSRVKHWNFKMPKVAVPDGGRLALVAWVSDAASLSPIQSVGGWFDDASQ